jgi:hypothetical protein
VREQSGVSPDSFHEIDLSKCDTIEEQLRILASLNL